MKADAISRCFEKLSQLKAEPKTELDFTNPYTLLVAVALSAQATDVGVNKATKALFARVSTPEDMLALGLEGLKGYIKTIGLYNTKAKNLMAMAEMLVTQHESTIPQTREELEKLPGVGRKTANVVLNEAFDLPTIAVDTHIFRVGNRTGMAIGSTPLKVEEMLEKNIPENYKKHAHHWLILHGRYTCVARKPKCNICPIYGECNFKEKQPV